MRWNERRAHLIMTVTIAIIGRPNVGKSTLFNRLARRKLAIVHDEAGVTRDRREAPAEIAGQHVTLIDTAGLGDADAGTPAALASAQSEQAIAEADIVLFVIDARAGVVPGEGDLVELVRQAGKPAVLVANKCEGSATLPGLYEAFELGLGQPVAVSAEHGNGIADLEEALRHRIEQLPAEGEHETGADAPGDEAEDDDERPLGPDRPLKLAVVGRPNTGKSTLINRLIGEERLVTSDVAGTTRDAIAIDWSYEDIPVRLFDTAGLRKRARVERGIEKLSVADALRAIRFAEVAVLTIDATQPFEKQDLQVADLIAREGRATVIALTKWDLIEDKDALLRKLRGDVDRLLPQLRGVPVIALSSKTGRGLKRLMPAVLEVYEIWNRRISTGPLNRWLIEAVQRHPPPAPGGRRVRIRFITQPKARPPTFIAFCSRPKELKDAYLRYLINGLRDEFGFEGVPVRLLLRKGDNPYA